MTILIYISAVNIVIDKAIDIISLTNLLFYPLDAKGDKFYVFSRHCRQAVDRICTLNVNIYTEPLPCHPFPNIEHIVHTLQLNFDIMHIHFQSYEDRMSGSEIAISQLLTVQESQNKCLPDCDAECC